MNLTDSPESAPAATLVGSLDAFNLSDVLSLLAWTGQTGEFQVTSDPVEGRLWLSDGQLSNAHVGAATTIGQAVFELACATDGSFTFTPGIVSSSGQPPVPVDAVLDEVRPQVEEWRELRSTLPLEAVVTLSPDPPGQDVQIRNDQWQVLTTVGTAGRSVRSVLDQIGSDQVAGLRTLCDLHRAGLIVIGDLPTDQDVVVPATTVESTSGFDTEISTLASVSIGTDTPLADDADERSSLDLPGDTVVGQEGQEGPGTGSLAEVTIMPPPIATDPWAPTVQSTGSSANGSGDSGAA